MVIVHYGIVLNNFGETMIKKNSILFQIACDWGDFNPSHISNRNICTYVSCILRGLMWISVIIGMFSTVMYLLVVAPLMWLWVTYQTGVGFIFSIAITPDAAAIGCIAWIGIISVIVTWVIFCTIGYCSRVFSHTNRLVKNKSDGLVKTYIKSLKEKTCIPLDFE